MGNDPVVSRDEDLRTWRSQYEDATPIADLVARQKQTCVGVVHRIRIVPGHQLEITIEDGTGEITAIFSGRSNLPGLELGAAIRLTGTIASAGRPGLEVRNPGWDYVQEPYR
ncbi:MAG: OB-fold nucleic acid binding domain-containing protein [Egibacteraceae bacterium]